MFDVDTVVLDAVPDPDVCGVLEPVGDPDCPQPVALPRNFGMFPVPCACFCSVVGSIPVIVSRLGLPSIDRLSALPSDLNQALRLIPEIARSTAALPEVARSLKQVARDTEALPGIRKDMARVAEATSVLGAMDGRMAAIEEAMPVLVEVQRHLDKLPETMESLNDGLDRLSGLMEQLLAVLGGLNQSIDTLQAGVEPMGRLASRVPGQKKSAPADK